MTQDNRIKIYNSAKRIFDKEANCDKITNFIDSNMKSLLGTGKESKVYLLNIKNIDVALKTISYNPNPDYKWVPGGENDTSWINYLKATYTFMSESNAKGFDYFPYIYSVLDC